MHNLEAKDVENVAKLNLSWEKLAGKTLVISGGTGFLGQFLVEVIKYRNRVFGDDIKAVCLSRHPLKDEKNITYLKRDVSEKTDLPVKADYILHLASNTHPRQYAADPVGTVITNVMGCKNLLDVAVKDGARFLLASSVEIYGDGNGEEIKEDYCGYIDCNTARAGYNEAKRVCESLCRSYSAQYGVESVTVRLARCFGADRKDDSKAMAQFIKRAASGENILLKSKGDQRFSYCYVADAVSGILKVLTCGADGEAYNVAGDYENKSLGEYASFIAEYADVKLVREYEEQQGASKANYAVINCDKLKNLGWKPLYGVSAAIKRTVDILKG